MSPDSTGLAGASILGGPAGPGEWDGVMNRFLGMGLAVAWAAARAGAAETRGADVIVYGGTSAGVIAAVQAVKMGRTAILVCPDRHLGGLSSGGLGWTDTGNKAAIGGLSREFYHRVWKRYDLDATWRWQKREAYGNKGQGTAAIDGTQRTMWIFDPYVRPGDPSSGLLPRIARTPPGENGTGDPGVQAYCFRMCLTDHPENRVPFARPEGYDARQYELVLRVLATGWREVFDKFDPIPNKKTDTNNVWRYVTPKGTVQNEGDIGVGLKPYTISYGSLVPKRGECANLLVPVCVGSSHIAYGSIRMEPVFMILGQSAATAASLAIDAGQAVQDVDYAKLRARLLADGQVLEMPRPAHADAADGPCRHASSVAATDGRGGQALRCAATADRKGAL